MKKSLFVLLTLMLGLSAYAQEQPKNNFKFYGFIRNYFVYDSRESKSGTSDLFYYLPLDKKMNEDGTLDLNDHASFRYTALTSRMGVDVSGYNMGNVHFAAKLEADFYYGLSSIDATKKPDVGVYYPGNTSITGTAQMRLRQAYATATWKDLPFGDGQKASVALKVGQAWHPMGADFPHIFSLEVGAPFGPFSRTPLVQADANLGKNWILSAASIWQMQYCSQGPVGASAIYMKYGMTPELYLAAAYKKDGFLFRGGADLISIKPRVYGKHDGVTVRVSDRKTSLLYYIYTQYTHKNFAIRAKSVFGEGGEHMNLMTGYVKVGELEDGSWEYESLRNSSSWVSMSYGKKWQGVLFLGYMKNLGIPAEGRANAFSGEDKLIPASNVYFYANGSSTINQIYRINPQIIYNIGKLNLGLEYQWTSVQYGAYTKKDGVNYLNERCLATEGLHWIGNHRVNMMVKYNF